MKQPRGKTGPAPRRNTFCSLASRNFGSEGGQHCCIGVAILVLGVFFGRGVLLGAYGAAFFFLAEARLGLQLVF